MKFVTYFYQNKEAVGILKEEEKAVFPLPFADMDTLIQTSKENLQLAVKEAESSIPLVDVTLLAPDSKTEAGYNLPWDQLQSTCRRGRAVQ